MSIAPPRPPIWPSQHQPGRERRLWSWPALIAAGAGGAAVAATIATVITAQVAGSHPARTAGPAAPAATVTVTPTPPPSRAPMPAAQADQRTCQAWHATNDLIVAGAVAQSVIPQGMTITDPAVRANPNWTAGVQKAADLYNQAANTLAAGVAPGGSPALTQIAQTSASGLRTLSTAYSTFDPANGNAYNVMKTSQDAMNWLCR